MQDTQGGADSKEVQNARALQVLARVKEKLTGRDFKPNATPSAPASGASTLVGLTDTLENIINGTGNLGLEPTGGLPVPEQVDRLLRQAMDVENLCQHYIGWCSFW
jgi:serine/threonine-protein kinase mTOR